MEDIKLGVRICSIFLGMVVWMKIWVYWLDNGKGIISMNKHNSEFNKWFYLGLFYILWFIGHGFGIMFLIVWAWS